MITYKEFVKSLIEKAEKRFISMFLIVILVIILIYSISAITNYVKFVDLFLTNLYSYAYQDVKRVTDNIIYYNTLVGSVSDFEFSNESIFNFFNEYFVGSNINFEKYEEYSKEDFYKLDKNILEIVMKYGFYLQREFLNKKIIFNNYLKTYKGLIHLQFSLPLIKYAPFTYSNIGNIDDVGLVITKDFNSINSNVELITLRLGQQNQQFGSLKKFKIKVKLSNSEKIYIGINSILYLKDFTSSENSIESVSKLSVINYVYDKTYAISLTLSLVFISLVLSYTIIKKESNRLSNHLSESVTAPLEKLEESIRNFSKTYYIDTVDIAGTEISEIKKIIKTFEDSSQVIAAHVEELYATTQELEKTYSELERYVEKTENAYFYFVNQLAQIAEGYDEVTGNHIDRVGALAEFIAKKIGLPEELILKIYKFASLHDVGKILIPKKILMKQGPLTNDEFEIMKLHTILGAAIIGDDPYFESARYIALYHHEKYDGTGYPFGLKGDDIPIEAQIVGLVDIYDALRSERPYKKGFSHEETLTIITKGDKRLSPNAFNPKLLNVFVENQASISKIWDDLNSYNNSQKKNPLFESLKGFLVEIQKYDLYN